MCKPKNKSTIFLSQLRHFFFFGGKKKHFDFLFLFPRALFALFRRFNQLEGQIESLTPISSHLDNGKRIKPLAAFSHKKKKQFDSVKRIQRSPFNADTTMKKPKQIEKET